MIGIYRNGEDCPINEFCGHDFVLHNEVVIKTKKISGKLYTYAEPTKKGCWAFGGNILYTNNGVFPAFNTPIKLHDRNMELEK